MAVVDSRLLWGGVVLFALVSWFLFSGRGEAGRCVAGGEVGVLGGMSGGKEWDVLVH